MTEREAGVDEQIVEPLLRANHALDDIREAKLTAGIEAQLDALDGARPRARPLRVGWAAALVLAGAAAVMVVFHRSPTAPAPQTAGRRALSLSPYVYVGPGARTEWLEPVSTVAVPAGGQTRASVGKSVRLTLMGPGAVSASAVGGVTELALERGLLLVDFDHSTGGELRVLTHDTVVTVVGTLFAVDAGQGTPTSPTRVGVARGVVSVRGDGARAEPSRVAGGSIWTFDGGTARLPEDLAAALAEHDTSAPPPRAEGPPAAARAQADDSSLGDPPLVYPTKRGAPARPTEMAQEDRKDGRSPESFGPSALPVKTTPSPAEPPPAIADRPAAPDKRSDAESLYAAAEELMRRRANDAARRVLLELIARHPDDPRAEVALLDLARLALAAGNVAEARRLLSRLPDPTHDPALVEPAKNLRALTAKR